MAMPIATPHGSKLHALLGNAKLPPSDKPRVKEAVERYNDWVSAMDALKSSGDDLLGQLVKLLNVYKRYIETELIFDSSDDFLYRQAGQHKVGNSIMEEFLPRLADLRLVPGLANIPKFDVGSQKAFAAFTFGGTVLTPLNDGGVSIKLKDQDYAVSKPVYLSASTSPAFDSEDTYKTVLHVAYVAAECKTNLDKTMFNEGKEAARALKHAVAGSRYLLVCEWLDMPPITTKSTDIDEAIVLRKAKRLNSTFRSNLSSAKGRAKKRDEYLGYYDAHPLHSDCFQRIVNHLKEAFPEVSDLDESSVLEQGYF